MNKVPFRQEYGQELWRVISETEINYKEIPIEQEGGIELLEGLLQVNPKNRRWNLLENSKWLRSSSNGVLYCTFQFLSIC